LFLKRECSSCSKHDSDSAEEKNEKIDLKAPRKLREAKRDEKKVFNLISKYSSKLSNFEQEKVESNRAKTKNKQKLNQTMSTTSEIQKKKRGRKRKNLSNSLPLIESPASSTVYCAKKHKPEESFIKIESDVVNTDNTQETISHSCCVCNELLNFNRKRKQQTNCLKCSKWYHYGKCGKLSSCLG
jgi:hypothetical protein